MKRASSTATTIPRIPPITQPIIRTLLSFECPRDLGADEAGQAINGVYQSKALGAYESQSYRLLLRR